MPINIANAIPLRAAEAFDAWLAQHGAAEREVVVAIHKKASGKQTVTFDRLLEVALCHGWIDVQTKGIDAETYAIRFVPRRPGSHWSATNRTIARRLLDEGRMRPAGLMALPLNLVSVPQSIDS